MKKVQFILIFIFGLFLNTGFAQFPNVNSVPNTLNYNGWLSSDQGMFYNYQGGRLGIGLTSISSPYLKLVVKENSDTYYTYTMIRNDGHGGAGLWLHNGSNNSTGSSKVIFRNGNLSGNGADYWAMGSDRNDENKFKINHAIIKLTRDFAINRQSTVF